MDVKWVHELTVERVNGAEKVVAGFVSAWARQGFQLEREETAEEIRIRAEQKFKWGEDKA